MECDQAERLRNTALVSISRELRVLTKRRSSGIKAANLSLGKSQLAILMRKQTDQHRQALKDHLATCKQCNQADDRNSADLTTESEVHSQEPQCQETD
jgi:hypothetical protein